jgi:hypothetical protein
MFIVFVPASALIAVVVGVVVRLGIRLIRGMLGEIVASNIVTEDFAQWTLSPLRRWPTWRDILGRGLAASLTGGTIGGVVFSIVGCIIIVAQGKYKEDMMISLLVVPIFIVVGGLVSAPIGFISGTLLGIFRACRKIARFAKIKSPYQRLRAGIIFNMLQLIVIAVVFICLQFGLFLLVLSVGGKIKFPFGPGITIVTFGLLGLFRTPILKHAALRICLTLEGAMPLRYADFLSYATELRILETDDGQWRFRHQILQDYFTSRHRERIGSRA